MMIVRLFLVGQWILFALINYCDGQVPTTSQTWKELISLNGVRFTPRNGHATCPFQNRLWVVGGRVETYVDYNLQSNDKMADVWSSTDGGQIIQNGKIPFLNLCTAVWTPIDKIDGDFWAQNIDVVQPGPIAPWFNRFGHSLNAIDTTGDGVTDLMILAGGYSPTPDNDLWVTENGTYWMYAGKAPWSPRAWHGTVIFKNRLYLMGGSPLNNEIWRLNAATKYLRTEPITRSLYSNYSYHLEWEYIGNASWSPRVGMGLTSQWYFNTSVGQTLEESKERILLFGGYGGWLDGVDQLLYDGYSCRNDVWQSYDGGNWSLIGFPSRVNARAWMGLTVQVGPNPLVDTQTNSSPPKIFLIGGGNVGANTKKRVTTMIGRPDAYWSHDGLNWTQINYQEGGGSTGFTFYSSQEWTKTVVDTVTKYLGLWGHTLTQFNATATNLVAGGSLYLIGGAFAGGEYSNDIWQSTAGLLCDVAGMICNGNGQCNSTGCVCSSGYTGITCDIPISAPSANGVYSSMIISNLIILLCVLSTSLFVSYEF